jgi:hypothetical protein
MRSTKIVKSVNGHNPAHIYGYNYRGDIYVNIQQIYDEFGEKKFATVFGDVYTHELLHSLILDMCPEKEWTKLGEEIVVCTLGGYSIDELMQYKEMYKGKRYGKKSNQELRGLGTGKE